MKKKYNYFYKITNNINNHYYYGIHSTDNLDDGYMGSGKRLHVAYKKYGIENFTKEILKFFDNRNEALCYESEMVTEGLVNSNECYNIMIGGGYLDTGGKVPVIIKTTGEHIIVSCEEYTKNKNKYLTATKGFVHVKDENSDKYKLITCQEYFNNKHKYIVASNGMIAAKDKNGKYYWVSVDDERYKNGVLTAFWAGKKHSESTKQKMRESLSKKHHQQGERNSQYGKCWVTKNGDNKSIKKELLNKYLENGWIKGRALNMKNDKIHAFSKEEILKLRTNGLKWVDIAKKMGVSEFTIYRYKKINNL